MYQGTTPTLEMIVDQKDLTGATVHVSMYSRESRQLMDWSSEDGKVTLETTEDGGTSVILTLTQEETLQMRIGTWEVQIRFVEADGSAGITDIQKVTVKRALNQNVIEYEGD